MMMVMSTYARFGKRALVKKLRRSGARSGWTLIWKSGVNGGVVVDTSVWIDPALLIQ